MVVTVVPINDTTVEPNEKVILDLTTTNNAAISKTTVVLDQTATVVINDDLDTAKLNVAPGVAGNEKNLPAPFETAVNANLRRDSNGQEAPRPRRFRLPSRDQIRIRSQELTLRRRRWQRVQHRGNQRSPRSFTRYDHRILTIPAGSQTETIVVIVNDDEIIEDDEPVVVTLGTPLYASPNTTDPQITLGLSTSAKVLIQDEDVGELNLNVQNGFEAGHADGKFIITLIDPVTLQPTQSDRPTQIPFELQTQVPACLPRLVLEMTSR